MGAFCSHPAPQTWLQTSVYSQTVSKFGAKPTQIKITFYSTTKMHGCPPISFNSSMARGGQVCVCVLQRGRRS